MVRPKRSEQHPDLQQAIKQSALDQIRLEGAASLSLRGIARSLNITAPAIYNYFSNRDDLVTSLIIDAYDSFADALRLSLPSHPNEKHSQIFNTVAHAYRRWALKHPEEYTLMFATSIPGYIHPMDVIGPSASGSMMVLINTLHKAKVDKALEVGKTLPKSSPLLRSWKDNVSYSGSPELIHLALSCWAQLHGLVSLELHGHLCVKSDSDEVDAFFDAELVALQNRLGYK